MKRAIFVSVGTVVGLTATLRYTPIAPSLDTTTLALGGLDGVDSSPTATPDTGTPTPVPSVSASATKSAAASSTPLASNSATPTASATKKPVVKSTPKPKATKKPATTPTKKPTPTPAGNSGVYLGSVAQARPYGVVQVQIEVKSGKVTKIGVPKFPNGDQDSINISVPALQTLIDDALVAQSANLGSCPTLVSGATHTCDAFKLSLAAALQKAGL